MPENIGLPHAECEICGAEHDEAIHQATLRIHYWFRGEVTRYLFDFDEIVYEEEAAFQVA